MTMSDQIPRFPQVHVRLTGTNGNAFAILRTVREALRKAGVPQYEITQFVEEATKADYVELLMTCLKWVEVS
jgi:coproporphyrinogen III oxidase-like Fe-S oxidoreductase